MGASGMMVLPSGRLLQMYKNSIQQEHGILPSLLDLMQAEAERLKLPAAGYHGFLAHDEMKIQVSIIFSNSNCHDQLDVVFHSKK